MKRRKPKDVNLKPYDMWTDEDYENAIPQEVRDAFDKVTQKPKSNGGRRSGLRPGLPRHPAL